MPTMKKSYLTLVQMFLMLTLAACGSSKSPVLTRATVDRYAESEKIGGRVITIVQPGDTWYGIAFANSVNVSELAAWNGATESDKLAIGQRLRLTKPLGFQVATENDDSSVAASGAVNDAQLIEVRPPRSSAPQSSSNSTNNTSRNNPVSTKPKETTAPPPRNPDSVVIKPNSKLVKKAPSFDQKPVRWAWPLRGKLVSRFSPTLGRKGIDIGGKQNQEIRVAAPGKVVYQGNGIKGYNNLIIIKHSEDLLSAYAHNQKVYVREGQWVTANQAISTVGLRNGKPLLHFEIRRNGKPVDPLRYLGKQ